jgi:hypothetical protein
MRKFIIISTFAAASTLAATQYAAAGMEYHGRYGPYSWDVAVQQSAQWEHDHGSTTSRRDYYRPVIIQIGKAHYLDVYHCSPNIGLTINGRC